MDKISVGDKVVFPANNHEGKVAEISLVTADRDFKLNSVSTAEVERNQYIYFLIEWKDEMYKTGLYTYGLDFILPDSE